MPVLTFQKVRKCSMSPTVLNRLYICTLKNTRCLFKSLYSTWHVLLKYSSFSQILLVYHTRKVNIIQWHLQASICSWIDGDASKVITNQLLIIAIFAAQHAFFLLLSSLFPFLRASLITRLLALCNNRCIITGALADLTKGGTLYEKGQNSNVKTIN